MNSSIYFHALNTFTPWNKSDSVLKSNVFNTLVESICSLVPKFYFHLETNLVQFCLACHTIILPLPSECLDYQLVLAHLTAEGFTCVSVEFAFVLNFDFSSEAQIQGVIHDRYIVYNCYVPILTMFGRQRLT